MSFSNHMAPKSTERSSKRIKRMDLEMGLINGGGIRVVLNQNDSDDINSIVKTILSCKNEGSDYYKRFRGFKHSDSIQIAGKQWGKYSYRWLGADENAGATPDDLADLFRMTAQFCIDPSKPYTQTGNKRCTVSILSQEECAMDVFYSEKDIVQHCTSDQHKFQSWREFYNPFTQGQAFF